MKSKETAILIQTLMVRYNCFIILVHLYAYSVPLSYILLCLAKSVIEEVVYELRVIAVFSCLACGGCRLGCLSLQQTTS
jgi:hypothetical protein